MPQKNKFDTRITHSEAETLLLAKDFSRELGAHDWVFLEGPLGAGKSTFARGMIEALSEKNREAPVSAGSPTFSLVHDYGNVLHIDFYRIRTEEEIFQSGIESLFWERQSLIISEWISLFPKFQHGLFKKKAPGTTLWTVQIELKGLDRVLHFSK